MDSPKTRKTVIIQFAFLTIGAALGNLSQTGLNAMLPSVMASVNVEVALGQWLSTGYMLVLGIAVPVSTFMARRLSPKSYLLITLSLFALGCLIDWLAWEFWLLLFGRILQATAVGLIIPFMQDTAMTGFPAGQQATAMGVAGIALGFAPNIGPTVGGAMDSAYGWRSFFLLLFAIGVALWVLTVIFMDKESAPAPSTRFHSLSFVLSTLGFGGVLLGLSQASSFGFGSPWVWMPIVFGCLCIYLFCRRQNSMEDPLINLRIFRSTRYNWGILASVFLFASFMGVTLVIPLYGQGVLGWDSLLCGLVMLPATFTALLVNPLAGWLADKTSVRLVALIFGGFFVVGSVGCAIIDTHTTFLWLTVFQTLRSMGVSGLIGPLITYSLAGLSGPLIAHGSSASVILRQIAATFGTAIMVSCIALGQNLVAAGGASEAFPYQTAFVFSAVMSLACFVTVIVSIKKEIPNP